MSLEVPFMQFLLLYFCFNYCSRYPRALHSFPTRRSSDLQRPAKADEISNPIDCHAAPQSPVPMHRLPPATPRDLSLRRSEEHTSELQSPCNLVCRLLLVKKK